MWPLFHVRERKHVSGGTFSFREKAQRTLGSLLVKAAIPVSQIPKFVTALGT